MYAIVRQALIVPRVVRYARIAVIAGRNTYYVTTIGL